MLRNYIRPLHRHPAILVLNEVLSLNAQELLSVIGADAQFLHLLNEVLSLNAQECRDPAAPVLRYSPQ